MEHQRPRSLRRGLLSRAAGATAALMASLSAKSTPAPDMAPEPIEVGSKKRGRRRNDHYIGRPGRPDNIGPFGSVMKNSGIVIGQNTRPHMIEVDVADAETGELSVVRVQHVSKLKAKHGGKKYVVQVHRAVPLSVFNAAKNDAHRRAMSRFVGPFPTHGAA